MIWRASACFSPIGSLRAGVTAASVASASARMTRRLRFASGERTRTVIGREPALQQPLPPRGRNLEPMDQARVSLLRWLRRQLRVPGAMREHLEAAVENDDPAEARRVLARAEFSDAQRRYVEDVLSAWERQKAGAAAATPRR